MPSSPRTFGGADTLGRPRSNNRFIESNENEGQPQPIEMAKDTAQRKKSTSFHNCASFIQSFEYDLSFLKKSLTCDDLHLGEEQCNKLESKNELKN